MISSWGAGQLSPAVIGPSANSCSFAKTSSLLRGNTSGTGSAGAGVVATAGCCGGVSRFWLAGIGVPARTGRGRRVNTHAAQSAEATTTKTEARPHTMELDLRPFLELLLR